MTEQAARTSVSDRSSVAARALGEIPGLWRELPLFLVPGSGGDSEAVRSARAGSRAPLAVSVLHLQEGRELWAWCERVAEGKGWAHLLSRGPVPDMCAFLTEHAAWAMLRHKSFEQSVTSVWLAYREATRQPVRRWPCPDCKWADGCEPKGDPDPAGEFPIHMCLGCGRVWRLAELQERLDKHDRETVLQAAGFVPLKYAAVQVGRPEKTLRTWINNGKLAAAGYDKSRKVQLFSLDQVRRLAAETPTRVRKQSTVA